MKEEWKEVINYEGLYEVSNYGRLKSLPRLKRTRSGSTYFTNEKILIQNISMKGYVEYKLSKDGKEKSYKGHRLVAIHFISNPENKPQINHKDGVRTNNHVNNLEWSTNQENVIHKYKVLKTPHSCIGLYNQPTKSKEVAQLTKDGEFIKMWPSGMEIQRVLGFGSSGINKSCRGRSMTSYGFIWKYRNDFNQSNSYVNIS